MHEAQHITLVPGVKHTEVVRDVIGTVLPWGHAKVLWSGTRIILSHIESQPIPDSYRAQDYIGNSQVELLYASREI